jgi:signal transduction histidine kinase/CheY-like chemotaxis protein
MQSQIIKNILGFGIISGIISLILACIGFGVVEFYKIKDNSLTKLQSQVDILTYNLQPTLLFDDKDAAEKMLRALKDDKSITKAVIYRLNGKQFATYVGQDVPAKIKLSKDIVYRERVIGRLSVESIYLGVRDKYIAYLLISLLIILISIPASYIISQPIRQQVSEGVIQLEQQSNRLRQLADQVAATEQKERKRIAALIHDHLQQILAASKIQLDLALRRLRMKEYDETEVKLMRGLDLLNEVSLATRSLTVELRPPVLYEAGVSEAFKWLANKFKNDYNLDISLDVDDIAQPLSDNLKILIFESVKELLFNVVKYAGVHAAELSFKYRSGSIFVCVKDKGQGFDVVQSEKISSAKGFGLFSIRERIKLLNGSFHIHSEPNHGTEIQITIPLDKELPESLSKPTSRKQNVTSDNKLKGRKINILLVDDHKIVREGLANLLKENDSFHIVAQAENGIEAVEKTRRFHPDIVIMDINMPKLNGIEATRVIKNKFSDVKVIGLSVQDERDVSDSMKKAGAVTLINKAGDPQELIQAILNVCA